MASLNQGFEGTASDMAAAMAAAGIKMPEVEAAAARVAAAPASAPEVCSDPDCTHDHGHGDHGHEGHDHGHEHGHGHGDGHKEEAGHGHDHGHEHGHGHKEEKHDDGHDHGHDHAHMAAAEGFTPMRRIESHHPHGVPSRENAPVQISCEFDSGNIEVVDDTTPSEGLGVQLKIRPDVYTELEKKSHLQWFHFKASGADDGSTGNTPTKFTIVNAGKCSFPDAWPGTTVCASFDRVNWFRCLDTVWDPEAGSLSWTWARSEHPGAEGKSGIVAYFAPYSYERHLDTLGRITSSPLASSKVIGRTLDGRDLDLVTIGTGPIKVWAIHRQHPGESQAEFYAEGLMNRLVEKVDDALARKARQMCTFYIIPNMNPDGSVRGHLRTNACGANLNREWQTSPDGSYEAPTLKRSPEVYYCLQEMDKIGVDMFVDVHGDEEIPMNFVSGMEGLKGWGPRLQALQGAFVNSYVRFNPDFQSEISYEPEPPNEGNLAICSNHVANRFNCLGVTLEQPFKDCVSMSDPAKGWSPERCMALGASLVDVAIHCAPYVRAEGPFWETMDAQDAYTRPTEGTANSTIPQRSAGWSGGQEGEITQLDAQLAEAEAMISQINAKRAALNA